MTNVMKRLHYVLKLLRDACHKHSELSQCQDPNINTGSVLIHQDNVLKYDKWDETMTLCVATYKRCMSK